MLRILEKIRSRRVVWVVDAIGCTGKSCLVDVLCLDPKYKCLKLTIDSFRSMKYSAAKSILDYIDRRGHEPEALVIDASRDDEMRYLHEIYGILEQLNDGRLEGIFLGRNVSSRIKRKIPIFVFSNSAPLKSALSDDRWEIMHIIKVPSGTDYFIQPCDVFTNVQVDPENKIVSWRSKTRQKPITEATLDLTKESDVLLEKMFLEMLSFKMEESLSVSESHSFYRAAPILRAPETILLELSRLHYFSKMKKAEKD